MLRYTVAHDLHGLQSHPLHVANALLADDRQELLQAMADPADQLPTVAPTGAPADLARFEQDHREATLGQLQGRVQTRVATADDAHIGGVITLQKGMIRVRRAAGGVIRSGVLRAVDHWTRPGAWAGTGG